jgi:hypothetical protein
MLRFLDLLPYYHSSHSLIYHLLHLSLSDILMEIGIIELFYSTCLHEIYEETFHLRVLRLELHSCIFNLSFSVSVFASLVCLISSSFLLSTYLFCYLSPSFSFSFIS